MKIVFIYRKSSPGAFSIEQLFNVIAAELKHKINVIEFEVGPRTSLIRDVWRLRKMNADIYHITGDINFMALMLPWRKIVLTVHDIGHFLFGLRGIKRWLYKWLWLLLPIRTARVVTTVSKATEDNIVEHLGFPRSKLITIDNCHSPRFSYESRLFNKEYPVILQVGTKQYKNVPRLIEALRGVPCKLVLIGRLDEPIRKQLTKCGTDYENRVNLTSEQIAQAYIESDIVSFVSIGEGFGVPIIEAQASGRPLITANIPPMSNVAAEGACQVSPFEVSEIREGILKIIHDDNYRDRIVQAGIQNASRFSPQVISDQYLDLYKRMREL